MVVVVSELAASLSSPPETKTKTLGKLAELLERQNISIEEVGEIKRVSLYQSLTKNEEGDPVLTSMGNRTRVEPCSSRSGNQTS